MTNEPKIRDLYQDYVQGRIDFEDLVEAANTFLAGYEARRTTWKAPANETPGEPRNVATAVNNEPRMRELYQEYLHGGVTYEQLVETANRRLARWEAEQAALEPPAAEPRVSEPGS